MKFTELNGYYHNTVNYIKVDYIAIQHNPTKKEYMLHLRMIFLHLIQLLFRLFNLYFI